MDPWFWFWLGFLTSVMVGAGLGPRIAEWRRDRDRSALVLPSIQLTPRYFDPPEWADRAVRLRGVGQDTATTAHPSAE